MRTDPHQMAIMDSLAEKIRTIRSEGMAQLALTHEARLAQMPPRCRCCRGALTTEEIDHNARHGEYGQSRCFICIDELSALAAYESQYEPLPAAVELM